MMVERLFKKMSSEVIWKMSEKNLSSSGREFKGSVVAVSENDFAGGVCKSNILSKKWKNCGFYF